VLLYIVGTMEDVLKNLKSKGLPSPYGTPLNIKERLAYDLWKVKNQVQDDPRGFNNSYDMEGFFKDMVLNNPNKDDSGITTLMADGIHYPDKYKTPFHPTTSNESKYKMPSMNRNWLPNGDGTYSLTDLDTGKIIRDERNAFQFPGLLRG